MEPMYRGPELVLSGQPQAEIIPTRESALRIEQMLPDQSPLEHAGLGSYRLLAYIDYVVPPTDGSRFPFVPHIERYHLLQAAGSQTLRLPYAVSNLPDSLRDDQATVEDPYELTVVTENEFKLLKQANEEVNLYGLFDLLMKFQDSRHGENIISKSTTDRIFIGYDQKEKSPIITKDRLRVDPLHRLAIASVSYGALLHTGETESSRFKATYRPGVRNNYINEY